MKRKIILSITALALIATMLLALTSCGAILGGFGASTNDITRKLKYELNDTGDGYIVVGSEDYAPKVVIPDTYEGKPVVGIDSGAFSKSTDVHRVVIGDNVTTIGDWAFYECNNLTSITIGESVTEIDGDGIDRIPFFGCVKLVEVINKSALDITAGEKDYGFVGYYAKEVHNEESKVIEKDGFLFYTFDETNYLLGYLGSEAIEALPVNYNGQNYEIYDYALQRCITAEKITIPSSVTAIGDYSFAHSNILSELIIPGSVTRIGSYAFTCSFDLTKVEISDGVTCIDYAAFRDCILLTEVTIGSSVNEIGYGTFIGCNRLNSVTFEAPEGWWYAFESGGTGGVSIPEESFSDSATAATSLTSTYCYCYLKRT